MKISNFQKIALLSGALLVPAYADKVKLEQLPQHLQEKIRAQTGGAPIEDIDRDVRNGKTTYEVAFKRNGQNTELLIEDPGYAAPAAASATAPLDSRKLTRNELPVPVRRVVNSRLSGMEINDIERNVKNGEVTYGVGYKQAGGVGPQQELILSQDGTVLRSSAPLAGSSVATTPPPTVNSPVTTPTYPVRSRTISYSELPSGVRQVAEANLRNGDVKKVERRLQNGQVDYAINFLKENGQTQQMVIAQDGRILANQMISTTDVGTSAAGQSGAATSTPATNTSLLNRVGSAIFNGK